MIGIDEVTVEGYECKTDRSMGKRLFEE